MATQRQVNAPAAANNADDVASSISKYLSSKNVQPTQAWMQAFIPTIRLNTPVVALQKTALFRLLATDLRGSVQSTTVFPANVAESSVRELHLRGPITVQLLDMEDIGRSRWSQVEAIEAQERGETTKGREVIRVVPEENNGPPGATQPPSNANSEKSFGPQKLTLQDAKGTKAYAMELEAVHGISTSMSIGAKLVLRDVLVARGLLLLEPKNVEILGGKVDAWDKKWREDRKRMLKEKAGMRDTA